MGSIISPRTSDTASTPLPLPFDEKTPSIGSSTFIPKKPKITDGIPASKWIIDVNTRLTRTGQNFEMKTAVKKPSMPPKATEPPESRPAESTAPTAPPPTETNPEPESPAETQPPNGFTEADHNRIVSEVKAYAESYKAKGFTFVWSDSLEFGWDVGWMGTPRISRDSVDGTIKTLKHHVDLIYKSGTDPANGVTADSVLYRVVQLEIDGGIAYAVIYG